MEPLGEGGIRYPHNLANQVTLFQPGQTDNAFPLPPNHDVFLRLWNAYGSAYLFGGRYEIYSTSLEKKIIITLTWSMIIL